MDNDWDVSRLPPRKRRRTLIWILLGGLIGAVWASGEGGARSRAVIPGIIGFVVAFSLLAIAKKLGKLGDRGEQARLSEHKFTTAGSAGAGILLWRLTEHLEIVPEVTGGIAGLIAAALVWAPFIPMREVTNAPGTVGGDTDGDLGRSPLHYAAMEADAPEARRRLEAGDDPALHEGRHGYTPLHFAAEEGALEVAKLLVDAGAEVDARDHEGNTPLWRAVFAFDGDDDMIAFLRSRGADPRATNNFGKSPLDIARRVGSNSAAECFADLPVS